MANSCAMSLGLRPSTRRAMTRCCVGGSCRWAAWRCGSLPALRVRRGCTGARPRLSRARLPTQQEDSMQSPATPPPATSGLDRRLGPLAPGDRRRPGPIYPVQGHRQGGPTGRLPASR